MRREWYKYVTPPTMRHNNNNQKLPNWSLQLENIKNL